MKKTPEYIEGPEAWTRFTTAMQSIVKVPKSAMPPTPFGRRKAPKQPAKYKD